MRNLLFLFVALICYQYVLSLPVDKKNQATNSKVDDEIDNLGLEYGRYLQEVVMTLEQDKHFSEKLQNVSSEDIKSGKIAGELDFVHHNIRTKLDELKRIELDRLRKLIKQENELNSKGPYIDSNGRKWYSTMKENSGSLHKYEHVDHGNQHQFTKEDLHALIIKASNDLEELDKKRREEFKQYEMEKEFQYQESLKNMTAEQKAETIKKHDEQAKKHKEHPRVHHPGSKQQFQEVWEKEDHMPAEEFNPKTFFALHDINGDGVLDQEEVESLLSTEIKKLYDPNNPEDDPNEMNEEYHRMREHIYKEADKDRDGLISRKEFLDLTSKPDFDRDEGWKTIDEQQIYTADDLKQYEKHREEALQHQYAYYVQNPAYYHPQMMQPPYQGVPGGVAYVPVQQHPQLQHPGNIQQHPQLQQYPGNVQQHPQLQQPGIAPAVGYQQYQGVPQQGHPQMQQHPGNVQQQHPQLQQGHPQMQQHPGNVQQQQPQFQQQQPQFQQQQPQLQQPGVAPAVGYQQQVPNQQYASSNIPQQQQQVPQQQVPQQQQQQQYSGQQIPNVQSSQPNSH